MEKAEDGPNLKMEKKYEKRWQKKYNVSGKTVCGVLSKSAD